METETTWKLLFDGPLGFRLIVEYHSDERPEDHEATHRKLVDQARELLRVRPDLFAKPVRLVPVQRTATRTILHDPILIDHTEKEGTDH